MTFAGIYIYIYIYISLSKIFQLRHSPAASLILLQTHIILSFLSNGRSSLQRCSVKKVFLKISQDYHENTCAGVSFLISGRTRPATLLKKQTLAQTFSFEICKIFKKTFFYRAPQVTASEMWINQTHHCLQSVRNVFIILAKCWVCMPAGNQKSENLLVLQRNNGSQIKLLFLHLHHYTKKKKDKEKNMHALNILNLLKIH